MVSPYSLDRPGGVQSQAEGLVGWLRKSGHDAWMVGPGEPDASGYRFAGRVTPVRANGSVAPVSLDPRALATTRRLVKGAEVVHVHEPLAPMVGPGGFLGTGAPAVGTFHADPSGFIHLLYRGAAPILRRIIGSLEAVTAVSRAAAAAVAPFAGDVPIIPNGLDVDSFRVNVTRQDHRVVFVGRDEPRKGLDVLLAAWPRVREEVTDAELVVVGSHRRVSVQGVRFLGSLQGEAKRRELGAAAVFCAPNLGGESFGIVLIEALAAGCAAVVSDLAPFRAVAGDAVSYVPPGDSRALAEGLVFALRHPEAPGPDAVARFDWREVGPRYVDLFRHIVQ